MSTAAKVYVNLTVFGESGRIYEAKNTKLSRAINEANRMLQAKVDDRIKITAEGVE